MGTSAPGRRGRIVGPRAERHHQEVISGGRRVRSRVAPQLSVFLESDIGVEGGRYRFTGREALREVVDHLSEILRLGLPERTVSVLKGTQIGMTTVAIGLALYCVRIRRLNVGYFLPDQDFANRFGDTRIRTAIRNPRFSAFPPERTHPQPSFSASVRHPVSSAKRRNSRTVTGYLSI